MTDPVLLALIAAVFGSIISPVVVYLIDRERRRQDRAEDIQQRNEVACKVASVASGLALNTNEVAKVAKITTDKLDVIHTLVNSSLTAAVQSEYDATRRELVSLREIVELKKAAGHNPTEESTAVIEATVARISELAAKLADRAHQAGIVAAMPKEPAQ